MHGRKGHLGRIATAIALTIVLALIAVAGIRLLRSDARTVAADPTVDPLTTGPSVDPVAADYDHETPNPVDPVLATADRYPADAIVDPDRDTRRRMPETIRSLGGVAPAAYAVSPDARLIAFLAPDEQGVVQVHVATLDGTNVRQLTDGPADASSPHWSPDGRTLAYGRHNDIVLIDVATGDARRLSVGRQAVWEPSFHPDGHSILYTSSTQGGRRLGLWSVPIDGGPATEILRDAAFGSYSPDGTTIAYNLMRAADESSLSPFAFAIGIVNADGTDARRLVASSVWNPYGNDWSRARPDWSPDGSRIAYQASGWHWGEVRVVNVSTGRWKRIGSGRHPAWLDAHTLVIETYSTRGKGR
jgi:WD40 repeat protein